MRSTAPAGLCYSSVEGARGYNALGLLPDAYRLV